MIVRSTFLLITILLVLPNGVFAQEIVTSTDTELPPEQYFPGTVLEILEERHEDVGLGVESRLQTVAVELADGEFDGEVVAIEYGSVTDDQALEVGQQVVVLAPPNVDMLIFDRYRLPALGAILVAFVVLAVVFAGWRGVSSLAGLAVSILILALFTVPQIMAGKSPLLISFISDVAIALISIYLAHGFKRRTSVAVVSTLITTLIAMVAARLVVDWAGLTGIGSEEAFYLQTSPTTGINLRGLLLGGIIIGALGVLDDITTSQAAAVEEIWKADPTVSRQELYRRGASVGKEHITSLVNTLALAYVGASLPALLLFTVYQRPWWVVANTEAIAEEVIRTLVGSLALMVAVPITTFLAAIWLPRQAKAPIVKG